MDERDAEALLREAGHGEDAAIDLARTALAFSALDRPEAGHARYANHLTALAVDVAAAARDQTDLAGQAAALQSVLVNAYGYQGDRETYDDLRNADLAHVIDRRRGLPVALSILWLHCGRAQGWSIDGLNFPGHFLLRIAAAGERAVLDPFNDGKIVSPAELRTLLKSVMGQKAELAPDFVTPLSNRAILLRLQNNIKTRLVAADDTGGALRVLERMLFLAPDDAALWREAGLLEAGRDNLKSGLAHLDTALGLAKEPSARQRIAAEIAALRGKLN